MTDAPRYSEDAPTYQNRTFIDVRLCHGVAMPLATYGPLWPNVTSSMKPEVYNLSQRRPEEDRATSTGDLHKKS